MTTPDLSNIKNWLTLARTRNIGAIRAHHLIERLGNITQIITFLKDDSAPKKLGFSFSLPSEKIIEQEIRKTHDFGAHFITFDDDRYPTPLKAIADAPIILIAKGNLSLLDKKAVSIVGSRNASMNAKRFTTKIAQDLGQNGFVIVSGLARGIDTAAHEGAINTGTIGVIAGGIDHIYPRENKPLFEKLYKDGLVLTEMAMGYKVTAKDFPRRNRIVAGLSYGTIVSEAALKSGSLITARLSNEYGRDIYAIPGSPMDPRSEGTNALIQDGAKLIQSAKDVIDDLSLTIAEPKQKITSDLFHNEDVKTPPTEDDKTQAVPVFPQENEQTLDVYILSLLNFQGIEIDLIIRNCLEFKPQLTPAECLETILNLELMGEIERQAGNKIARIN